MACSYEIWWQGEEVVHIGCEKRAKKRLDHGFLSSFFPTLRNWYMNVFVSRTFYVTSKLWLACVFRVFPGVYERGFYWKSISQGHERWCGAYRDVNIFGISQKLPSFSSFFRGSDFSFEPPARSWDCISLVLAFYYRAAGAAVPLVCQHCSRRRYMFRLFFWWAPQLTDWRR